MKLNGYQILQESINKKEIEKKVLRVIEENLGVQNPKLTDHLGADLGADSLDIIELVMALEEEFNIEIQDEDVNMTVNDLNDQDMTVDQLIKLTIYVISSGGSRDKTKAVKMLRMKIRR